MKDIKIFVACHKESYVPQNRLLFPIQVGCHYTNTRFEGMLHDDIEKNISHKNKSYCELTALYWMWQNEQADYYGLFHYGRYLSFNENHIKPLPTKAYYATYDCIDDNAIDDICLNEEAMAKCIEEYDVIVPVSLTLAPEHGDNYLQYGISPHLHQRDYDIFLDIISEKYPHLEEAKQQYISTNKAIFCNIAIMKRNYFHDYCAMLFDILEEMEQRCDIMLYDIDEFRIYGHLSERFLGIYYTYLKLTGETKLKELRLARFQTTDKPYINQVFANNNIAVAMACNDAYAPYLGVLIQSISENACLENNYDIIILNSNISQTNLIRLQSTIEGHSNISIRFFDVSNIISDYNLNVKYHISIETWYRILLPVILEDYSKVLYLDCDLVANHDIAELYNLDMGDEYLLAGVRDLAIIGLYNQGSFRNYFSDVLKLDNPYNYIQAGVILFNLDVFRKLYDVKEILQFAQSNQWEWSDQDVINIISNKYSIILDMNWNVEHNRAGIRISEMRKSPMEYFGQYLKARENPYIVHYAGGEKPWDSPQIDLAEYFWKYARNSVYYEIILARMMEKKAKSIVNNSISKLPKSYGVQNPPKSLSRIGRLKISSSSFLPYGSKRREFVKRKYHFVRKMYRYVKYPPYWSIRSDMNMHIRIWCKMMLNFLHLGWLSKDIRAFRTLENRHKGERCFVVCTGPSLQIEDLDCLKNEYTFGVNSIVEAYPKTDWRPTYYTMVDLYALGKYLKKNDIYGGIYSKKESFVHYRAELKTKGGDEFYCTINYSNHLNRRIKKDRIKFSEHPGVCIYDCFTVTNMAIQLAVYMGFSDIYIIGADCNYDPKKMHFIETEIDNKQRNAKWLPGAVELSIQGYRAAKIFAEKHGSSIYNATRGGMLEVFERVDFDSIDLR